MRVVLDTNVVASALLWRGPPRALLHAARSRQIDLFTSTALLTELLDILARRKFAAKIAASLQTVDQLVEGYASLAKLVRPLPTPRIAIDPDDDVVIGTALAARAEVVVTGDKPLLTVGSYESIRVVGVAESLELLASKKAQ